MTAHYHVLCALPGGNTLTSVLSDRAEADACAARFNGTVRECFNPFHRTDMADLLHRARRSSPSPTAIARRASDILNRGETLDRDEAIRIAEDEHLDAYADYEDGND